MASPPKVTTSDCIFADMQRVADSIKKEIESQLKEKFNTFEVVEHLPAEAGDPEMSYRMRIKVNDGGHIKVKTLQKDPNTDWLVNIEKYEKGQPEKEVENGRQEKAE